MKWLLLILLFVIITFPVHAVIDSRPNTKMEEDIGIDGGAYVNENKKNTVNLLKKLLDFFDSSGSNTQDTSQDTGTNDSYEDLPLSVTPIPNAPSADDIIDDATITYPASLAQAVQGCMNNRSLYEAAAGMTGVPWQVLAGIHYREGGCDPTKSLVSGRKIGVAEPDVGSNCSSQRTGIGIAEPVAGGCGFSNFLDSAVYGANHLKGKIGGIPESEQELAKALGGYNGWGNANCGKTPYQFCPPAYKGDDHVYVYNKHPDGKHNTMYLVYCADRQVCNPPRVYEGIGALTATKVIMKLSSTSL